MATDPQQQPEPQQPQQPAQAPQPAVPARTTPSVPTWEIVVMASGALALIGSFLAFYKIPGELAAGLGGFSWSAWENAFSLFPVATLAVLYVVLAAAQVAVARFTGLDLPARIAGFGWNELRMVAGALATIVMLGYLLRSWPEELELDKGAGLYLVTLAAIGLVVGAVMERGGGGAPSDAGAAPARTERPTPLEIAIMAAGAVILIASFLTVFSEDAVDESRSAWGEYLFPLFTIPALLGAAMGAQVALERLTNVSMPRAVLGIEWAKVHVALGLQSAVMMLGLLVGNVGVTIQGQSTEEPSRGVGFWLMLIATLVLAGAAIARYRERDGAPAEPRRPEASQP